MQCSSIYDGSLLHVAVLILGEVDYNGVKIPLICIYMQVHTSISALVLAGVVILQEIDQLA